MCGAMYEQPPQQTGCILFALTLLSPPTSVVLNGFVFLYFLFFAACFPFQFFLSHPHAYTDASVQLTLSTLLSQLTSASAAAKLRQDPNTAMAVLQSLSILLELRTHHIFPRPSLFPSDLFFFFTKISHILSSSAYVSSTSSFFRALMSSTSKTILDNISSASPVLSVSQRNVSLSIDVHFFYCLPDLQFFRTCWYWLINIWAL